MDDCDMPYSLTGAGRALKGKILWLKVSVYPSLQVTLWRSRSSILSKLESVLRIARERKKLDNQGVMQNVLSSQLNLFLF